MPIAIGPKALGIKDMKSKLLNPALTSLYYVTIGNPAKKLIATSSILQDKINLMCCEASLPGSSLATLELTNDHTGVTERHAYRRVYDDRIDLTFYVESQGYGAINFFEAWIKFISQESVAEDRADRRQSIRKKNAFYGFAYPDSYMDEQGFTITKFEKSSIDSGGKKQGQKSGTLTYYFVNSFPISISSMPISYDSSSLLKCTVSMSYMRYYVTQGDSSSAPIAEGIGNTPGANTNYSNASLVNLSDYLKPGAQASINGYNFGGDNFFTQNQVNGFNFSAPGGTPAGNPTGSRRPLGQQISPTQRGTIIPS